MSTGTEDENLSAEELAALSEAFAPGDARSSDEVRAEQEPIVLKYDLVGASAGQRHDFPALDLIHETFAVQAGPAMMAATNTPVDIQAVPPELMNFSEIYASLSAPCAVVVVEVEGLGCTGLLSIEPNVLMHMVDLMMGGSGSAIDATQMLAGRSFTQTENHLIRTLTQHLSVALERAWSDITPVALRATRAEVDPRHAAIFMPSDRMIEFRLNMAWEEVKGGVRLAFPMMALRPFEQRLARTAVSPPNQSDNLWRDSMRDALEDVPVRLTGILGRTTLSIDEILKLEVGDLLRLDRPPNASLEMLVEGISRYDIEPGVKHGNIAAVMIGAREPGENADELQEQTPGSHDPDSASTEEAN